MDVVKVIIRERQLVSQTCYLKSTVFRDIRGGKSGGNVYAVERRVGII